MKQVVVKSLAAIAILTMTANAQNMKFPQQKNYDGCIKPDVAQSAMNDQVIAAYNAYKNSFIKTSKTTSGGYYVESKNTAGDWDIISVSEAHGWGMVIMTQMAGYDSDAKKIFDGMVKFYLERKSTVLGSNLMGWQVFGNSSEEKTTAQLTSQQKSENSSATDGDVDIAYALLLASKQWGGSPEGSSLSYKELAVELLKDIKKYNIHPSTNIVKLGSWAYYSGSEAYDYTRPSDWMAGHFRTFADATGESSWDVVANTIYDVYNKFQSNDYVSYGLVSDFIHYDGSKASSAPSDFLSSHGEKYPDRYHTNAARVPWRLAADYALSKDSNAKSALDKINGFINDKVGRLTYTNVKEGYWLSGDAINNNAGGAAYLGPFVTAKIASNDQAGLTTGWHSLNNTTPADAYQAAIRLQSMLLVSGNWWHYNDANTGGEINELTSEGIFLDDFADSDAQQSKLSNEYGKEHNAGEPWNAGGYWYAFSSDADGKVQSMGGTDIGDKNGEEMFNTGASTMEFKIIKNGAVAVNFPADKEFDLSDLEGFTVRAKGTGEIRLAFNTNDDLTLGTDEFRGGYKYDITLGSDFKEFPVKAALLAPEDYSIEHTKGYSWAENGSKRVTGFTIKSVDNTDAEITLDWIKFNGANIKNETFGFKTPEVLEPIEGENVAHMGEYAVYTDSESKGTAEVVNNEVKISFDRADGGGNWDKYVSISGSFNTGSGDFAGLKTIEISYTADQDIALSLPMLDKENKYASITGDAVPAHVIVLPKGENKTVTKNVEDFLQPSWWLNGDDGKAGTDDDGQEIALDLAKVFNISLSMETPNDAATKGNLTIKELKFAGVSVTPTSIEGINGKAKNGLSSLYSTAGVVRAELSLPQAGTLNLAVANAQGRIVARHDVTAKAGLNKLSLDMSGRAAGLYFLVVKGADLNLTQKFILK